MKFRIRRVSTSGMRDFNDLPLCPWPDAKLEYDMRNPEFPEAYWTIELNDISDLTDLMDKLDESMIIMNDEPIKTIWIYDDYFE